MGKLFGSASAAKEASTKEVSAKEIKQKPALTDAEDRPDAPVPRSKENAKTVDSLLSMVEKSTPAAEPSANKIAKESSPGDAKEEEESEDAAVNGSGTGASSMASLLPMQLPKLPAIDKDTSGLMGTVSQPKPENLGAALN